LKRIGLDAILHLVAINLLRVVLETGAVTVSVHDVRVLEVGVLGNYHGRRFENVDAKNAGHKPDRKGKELEVVQKFHSSVPKENSWDV